MLLRHQLTLMATGTIAEIATIRNLLKLWNFDGSVRIEIHMNLVVQGYWDIRRQVFNSWLARGRRSFACFYVS